MSYTDEHMSFSVTGPAVHKNDNRKGPRLSKSAIDCMKDVLTELEQKNRLASGDLIDQLDNILKSRFRQDDKEKPMCQYFTKNGLPCRRPAIRDSNFCSVHKNNGLKYAALESLFREKFKRETERACDAIDLRELVLRSESQNHSDSSS